MNTQRNPQNDRRRDRVMPRAPFKDSNGATIKECRRKIPDRRQHSIETERIDRV